jgi:accessory gene regulator protein AgrB
MNNTKEIQNYFNFQNVSQLKKHRMYVILIIFTITSLIEDFYKNGSTLLMYRDKNFDYKS